MCNIDPRLVLGFWVRILSTNDFFEQARLAIEKCENKKEMKLEIEFEHVLKNYFEYLGFSDIEGQYEEWAGTVRTVNRRRQDATYGKVIIEYERVGMLSSLAGKDHAIGQIRDDYLSSYPKELRKEMVGIVFDGKTVIFVRWVEEKWEYDERDFDKKSFDLMTNFLVGLFRVSFAELASQFGFNRIETRNRLGYLYRKTFENNRRLQMLFGEWKLRFSSIYGNAFRQDKIRDHFRNFGKELGIDEVEATRFVFVIHTYYAFIVKLIAAQVATSLFEHATHSYIRTLVQSEAIEKKLIEIEDGKFFRDIGVENFIEGTFLSWYLDIWDNGIRKIITDIAEDLDRFDFAEFVTRPEHVVDYLKNFYQEVFPKQLRHDLGEFYTPDWLARYVINESGFTGDVNIRILDPACGSGTFLVSILDKIYERNKKEKQKEKLLSLVTRNVVGFDINPVAVLTARTNYLIALSRFDFQKTRIVLPIYLTDSIVLPELAEQTELTDKTRLYKVKTTRGVFELPVDVKYQMAEVMQFLKDSLEKDQHPNDVRDQLRAKFKLSGEAVHHLSNLFRRIDELNKQNENKIWCDIITNQFATYFQGRFDFVIGNPPWVNWEFLDDEYQKELMNINDDYGLFTTKGLESRLGKIRRDISAIFFYVCADVYLKDGGIIALLLKPMYQIPSGRGFRDFNRRALDVKIKKLKTSLKLIQVEDITEENPFEIGNEVSFLLAKKGDKTKYPITYKKWAGGRTHELENYQAEPSDQKDKRSSWLVYRGKRPILGNFNYTIRAGVYFGLKEALFDLEVPIDKGNLVQITNYKGKAKDIEKGKIYPLIKSRHLRKWRIGDDSGEPYTYCILPQGYPGENNERELKREYGRTWEWLNDFRDKFLSRKSKVFEKDPFYSIYGLGDWDSKYKVVWKSMGFYPDFAVISTSRDKKLGKRLIIPEHVINFIPCQNKKEAHYVCAVLNSSVVRESLRALSAGGKSGLSGSIVKKVRLDVFQSGNRTHRELVKLSMQASRPSQVEDKVLKRLEKRIDLLVERSNLVRQEGLL